MKSIVKAAVLGAVIVAGMAHAEGASDPMVKDRQALMGTIGMNTKILGEMAGGNAAFDAAAAETAKAAIAAASAEIGAKFEMQATDPKSTAKPDVWSNWDDFMAKANALTDAVNAMDTTTVEGVQGGMGAIGGACKDCHSTYRSS